MNSNKNINCVELVYISYFNLQGKNVAPLLEMQLHYNDQIFLVLMLVIVDSFYRSSHKYCVGYILNRLLFCVYATITSLVSPISECFRHVPPYNVM